MVLKSGLHFVCECAKLSLEVSLFHAVLAISLLDCNIVGDVVTASEQRNSASYYSELDHLLVRLSALPLINSAAGSIITIGL